MSKAFSSQGERKCRVYPNATQVIILHTGSSGRYDDAFVTQTSGHPGQLRGQELPGMP